MRNGKRDHEGALCVTQCDSAPCQYALGRSRTGRIRTTGRVLADRTILTVLGIALANSVLGITWPWWGS